MKRDLDKYFPRNGPCVFHPTLYARHRVVDSIRAMNRAGDSIRAIMAEFELSRDAVVVAAISTPDDNRMTRKEINAALAAKET